MPVTGQPGRLRLAIIGGGRMGSAILRGLVSSAWSGPSELAVVEKDEGRLAEVITSYPEVLAVSDPGKLPARPEGAILAVKPQDASRSAAALAGCAFPPPRVLSVMAGISMGSLRSLLPGDTVVLRAMPNTPALVGRAISALALDADLEEADLAWAESLLSAIGAVLRVPEDLIDAVTGLSGSGPAYVCLVVEALIEGGVAAGLARDIAEKLAVHTVAGTGELLLGSGEAPGTLRAAVTSPGGTTAAGLQVLEAHAVRAAFAEAVLAATRRSRELGA